MALTARQLNRATLARQLLVERESLAVPDAVRRIVAIQAQEPASPYVALWNRIADFDPVDLDAAFTIGSVVKATLIRITLHAVHADDYPAFHAAMVGSLRASCLFDARFKDSRMSIDKVDALLPALLAYLAEPHTVPDIERYLEECLGEHRARLWWALRTFAPLHHAPTGGRGRSGAAGPSALRRRPTPSTRPKRRSSTSSGAISTRSGRRLSRTWPRRRSSAGR